MQGCASSGKPAAEATPSLAEDPPGAGQTNIGSGPSQVRAVPPVASRPTKLVPARAYARDGASFYRNGQLIRIQGLDEATLGGEHAKQRLQQLLDRGQVSVLPVGESTGGGMVAVVRINGRDVAQGLTY